MKLRALFKDNKGAGIITVLVGIMFLTAFGSVLLMLSYTGFEMRASDRKGKQNLYDASAVMEEIRAGVQELCSDAIVSSYESTLIKFNDYGTNVTRQFQENYRGYIVNSYYDTDTPGWEQQVVGETTADKLVLFDKVNNTYNIDVLSALVSERLDADVELFVKNQYRAYPDDDSRKEYGIADNLNSNIVAGEEPLPLILKGVGIKYTKDGRTTTETSDFKIDYPSIGYSNNTYTESGINSHACVVMGKLTQEAGQGNCSIYGDAYIGEGVYLKGAGSTMRFKGDANGVNPGVTVLGKLVEQPENSGKYVLQGGKLDIQGNANSDYRFTAEGNHILWANDTLVTMYGSAALLGNTYMADDLKLNNNTKAKLKGTYIGFGNSRAGKTDDEGNLVTVNPDESSAILIDDPAGTNAAGYNDSFRNITLDLSELDNLSLAGCAFIGKHHYGTPAGVMTGSSVAVTEDQTAYLLDIQGDLGTCYYIHHGTRTDMYTNPTVMPITTFQQIQNPDREQYPNDGFYIEDTVLWKKTASDYGEKPSDYGLTSSSVKAVMETFPGLSDGTVYVFVDFKSSQQAGEFFKDYFRHNPVRISYYLDFYADFSNKATANNNAGVSWYYDEGYKLESYTSNLQALDSLADIYRNNYYELILSYKDMVSEYIDMLGGNDPYKTFYSDDGSGSSGGDIVAVVANGDVEIKNDGTGPRIYVKNADGNNRIVQGANPEKVCYIITSGNLTVDGVDFNGLLICLGDLELKHGANLNKNPQAVTQAYIAKAGDGSNITEYLNNEEVEEEKFGKAWIVTDLVSYDNWNRTTEDD